MASVSSQVRRVDQKMNHLVEIRNALGPLDLELSPSDSKIVEHPENEEHSCTVIARKGSKDSSGSFSSPDTPMPEETAIKSPELLN